MVKKDLTIKIDNNANRLRRSNGNFLAGIRDMEDEMAKEFSDDLADYIKDSIRQKFDRFDGNLEDGVSVSPSKSSRGGVSYIVDANAYNNDGINYAAWHEFAKTSHEAPVTGELKRWGAEKGYLKDWGQTVEVTPINQQEGSFMQPAVQKAISEQRKNIRTGKNAVSEGLKRHFGG